MPYLITKTIAPLFIVSFILPCVRTVSRNYTLASPGVAASSPQLCVFSCLVMSNFYYYSLNVSPLSCASRFICRAYQCLRLAYIYCRIYSYTCNALYMFLMSDSSFCYVLQDRFNGRSIFIHWLISATSATSVLSIWQMISIHLVLSTYIRYLVGTCHHISCVR